MYRLIFKLKREITIPPYKWVSRIDENPKTKHHTYFFDWIILTDDQRERMMDIFRNNPKFAAWIKALCKAITR